MDPHIGKEEHRGLWAAIARCLAVLVLASYLLPAGVAGASRSAARPIVVARIGVGLVTVDPVTGKTLKRLTRAKHSFRTRGREPLWSPNGKKIAYAKGHEDNLEIWVMRADGTRKRRITHNDVLDQWPSWAPGSRRLAISRGGSRGGIYIVSADGSHQRKLTRGDVNGYCPDWSPDGNRIAFTRFTAEDIYTIKPDGTGVRQLTIGPELDSGPLWSSDGSKVLFRRRTDTPMLTGTQIQFDLFVVDRNGSNLVQLTKTSAEEYSWGWSPDGAKIAFLESEDALSFSLWVMNADGSERTELATGFFDYQQPSVSWSPNSRRIVYVRHTGEDEDVRADLWSMRADGSNDHRLKATRADETGPDWHAGPQECLGAY